MMAPKRKEEGGAEESDLIHCYGFEIKGLMIREIKGEITWNWRLWN